LGLHTSEGPVLLITYSRKNLQLRTGSVK